MQLYFLDFRVLLSVAIGGPVILSLCETTNYIRHTGTFGVQYARSIAANVEAVTSKFYNTNAISDLVFNFTIR